MGLLSDLWGGGLSSTDGPDWLVSDDDVAPLLLIEDVGDSLELLGIDLVGDTTLSLLLFLTNTEHNAHAVLDGLLGLDGGDLISLSEEGSSLGVTGEGVLELVSQQHHQRKARTEFVRTRGRARCPDPAQFVEHPVLGSIEAL